MDSQASPRILISDDQPDVLEALRLLLKPEGFHTETVTSPAGALAALQERDFDALLMDLNYTRDTTSGTEGLELLAKAQAADPTLPVIVMTAWGSIESAVEAMRRGARDYVEKPWDNARLLRTLRTQVDLGRALRATQRLETENSRLRRDGLPVLLGESRAMQPVHRLMEKIAPSSANVLITGEHGTGKEVVARWLHAASPRAGRPLVTVNAGGLSEGVFESEMFGHVRGAFTDAKTDRVGCFELADVGTLFLDEIANVPLAQQGKLLREFGKHRSVRSPVFSGLTLDDIGNVEFRVEALVDPALLSYRERAARPAGNAVACARQRRGAARRHIEDAPRRRSRNRCDERRCEPARRGRAVS